MDEGFEWLIEIPKPESDETEEDDEDLEEDKSIVEGESSHNFFRGEKKEEPEDKYAIGILPCNWLAYKVFELCVMPLIPSMGTPVKHGISATELRNAMFLKSVKKKMFDDTIMRVKEMERVAMSVFSDQVEKAQSK